MAQAAAGGVHELDSRVRALEARLDYLATKEDIGAVKALIAEIKALIAERETRMLRWLVGTLGVAALGMTASAVVTIARLLA